MDELNYFFSIRVYITSDDRTIWEYPIQWYLDQFTVVERNVTSILNKIGGTLVQIVRVNESDILPSTEPTGFSSVV